MSKINNKRYDLPRVYQTPGFRCRMGTMSTDYRNYDIFNDWVDDYPLEDIAKRNGLAVSTVEKIIRHGRKIFEELLDDPVKTLDPTFIDAFTAANENKDPDKIHGALMFLSANGITDAHEFLGFFPCDLLDVRFNDAFSPVVKILCDAYKQILKKMYPDTEFPTTYVFIKEAASDIKVGLSKEKAQLLVGEYAKDYSMTTGKCALAPITYVYLREKEV